jgi:hypothetical protein
MSPVAAMVIGSRRCRAESHRDEAGDEGAEVALSGSTR